MRISSPAFENEGPIPSKYTCDGESASPPLRIEDIPGGTHSLVLIVDDPDVPVEILPTQLFTHWVVFNIPTGTNEIPEGTLPGTAGSNSSGAMRYIGPCPPPDYEPNEHRYYFRLWALGTQLSLRQGASRAEIEPILDEHTIEYAEYMGRYKRPDAPSTS